MQKISEGPEKKTETTVLEASQALARTLGESDQFRAYERMVERMKVDDEARRILSEFHKAQEMFFMAQSWGGESREDTKKLEKQREQLLSNPTLKEYFQAQEDLVQLLQGLNAFISKKLGFDFSGLMKPAGGCC